LLTQQIIIKYLKVKKFLTGATFLICFAAISQAQIPEQLARQLTGKKKLGDIMPVVENYYHNHADENNEEDGRESKMMFWARWAEFWSSKLDANGDFTKYTSRMLQANNDVQQRYHPLSGDNPHLNGVTSTHGSWGLVGPTSTTYNSSNAVGRGLGRVDRIVFHPTDVNTIYIGTPCGGLWKTTNGGTNWSNLTKYLPSIETSRLRLHKQICYPVGLPLHHPLILP